MKSGIVNEEGSEKKSHSILSSEKKKKNINLNFVNNRFTQNSLKAFFLYQQDENEVKKALINIIVLVP